MMLPSSSCGFGSPNFYTLLILRLVPHPKTEKTVGFLSIHDSHACRGGISVLTVPEGRQMKMAKGQTTNSMMFLFFKKGEEPQFYLTDIFFAWYKIIKMHSCFSGLHGFSFQKNVDSCHQKADRIQATSLTWIIKSAYIKANKWYGQPVKSWRWTCYIYKIVHLRICSPCVSNEW